MFEMIKKAMWLVADYTYHYCPAVNDSLTQKPAFYCDLPIKVYGLMYVYCCGNASLYYCCRDPTRYYQGFSAVPSFSELFVYQ